MQQGKHMSTGEGGMVIGSDPALNRRMTLFSDKAWGYGDPKPDHYFLALNYRMTDLQGAVGIVQLRKLEGFIEERSKWAAFYQRELADVAWLRTPTPPADGRHGWQAYVTWVDPARAPRPRNEIMQQLQEQGISTRPGTHAVHMLGLYRDGYGIKRDDFPGARDCDQNTMAIPLHNAMTEEDYHYVVRNLKSIH